MYIEEKVLGGRVDVDMIVAGQSIILDNQDLGMMLKAIGLGQKLPLNPGKQTLNVTQMIPNDAPVVSEP